MDIVAWLKEPSTIKAIIMVAGLLGYHFDPTKVQEIIVAGAALYAAVGAFWDRQPRTPVSPAEPEETPLTEEGLKRLLAESKAKKNAAAP